MMQASTETFLHIILTPEEARRVVREFQHLAQSDEPVRWSEYPALDELSDRIVGGG